MRTSHPPGQKIWMVHLRKPLSIATESVLSVQLPPGDYIARVIVMDTPTPSLRKSSATLAASYTPPML